MSLRVEVLVGHTEGESLGALLGNLEGATDSSLQWEAGS
jgi:hypothetical protein